jgi:hypothetical protein
MYLEKTDRATMSASLEARVPFLDAAMTRAAEHVQTMDHHKTALRDLLSEAAPEVRTPAAKRGLSVDMESTVLRFMSQPFRYELDDSSSLLQRWAGSDGAQIVAERARRSPYLAFRLAMLGLWEQEFDGGTFLCG